MSKKKVIQLLEGNIHIEPDFFTDDLYKKVIKKTSLLKTKPTYQPKKKTYGNRMQAMPCYEAEFNFNRNIIIDKLEKLLDVRVINYLCIYRKIKTEELKKSQCNLKYGFTHKDTELGEYLNNVVSSEYDLAAVMHFDQSYEGGTAFFENYWDNKPDIYISAYPNRLIIYNSNRWHAPAFDYSFKERNSLAFFLKVKDEV